MDGKVKKAAEKVEAVNRSTCCLTLVFALCCCANATEVQPDPLLDHPARFDRQEIAVKGLFEVEGDDNYLWRDARARQHFDWKHWIHVYPHLRLPPYPGTNMSPDSPANLHWVKVTGVVDTSVHGRVGDKPFGLLQKKVEVVPGPRLSQFLTMLAWFKNDTGREICIEVTFDKQMAMFTMARGDVTNIGIEKGGMAVLKSTTDRVFARCPLTARGSERYYEAYKHAYYYRVTNYGITPVPPSEAKANWRLFATPDRD
jgi:hypothetical protein